MDKKNFTVLKILYILTNLDLFTVEGRLLRADIMKCWKIFHGKCEICPKDIFILPWSDNTRDYRLKIAHETFSMDCRILNGFSMEVICSDSCIYL